MARSRGFVLRYSRKASCEDVTKPSTSATAFVGQKANVWPDPGSGVTSQGAILQMDNAKREPDLRCRIDGLLALGRIGHSVVRLHGRECCLPARDAYQLVDEIRQ